MSSRWIGPTGLGLALAGGCGQAGEDDAAGPLSCSPEEDFQSCEIDGGGAGVCLGGSCERLPTCGDDGCGRAEVDFPLADTNLRACCQWVPLGSSEDGEIACPEAGPSAPCDQTPYCGQDAAYGWDTLFPPEARFTRRGEGDEVVVVDEATGLQWQGCVRGQTGAACDAGQALEGSWHEASDACEALVWGGHDDWTLPSVAELQSIVDYGTTSPAFDLQAFPNTPSRFNVDYDAWWTECTWTRVGYAEDRSVAWALLSNNGDFSQGSGVDWHFNDKDAEGWAGCTSRCVRRPAPLTGDRFLAVERVPGEVVVADLITQRAWHGCTSGQSGAECTGQASFLDWPSALAYCEGLGWGGFDDWRLPDIKELRSLVDLGQAYPAIDTAYFPGTPFYGLDDTRNNAGQFWSSTARSYNGFALYVGFSDGFSHFYVMDEGRHARCVRG